MDDKLQNFIKNIRNPEYISQQIASLTKEPDKEITGTQMSGITSLENMGNTCYLNSTLQCLRHLREFNGLVVENTHRISKILQRNFKNNPHIGYSVLLLINYIKLVSSMWKQNTARMSPICFRILFGESAQQFANCLQHDAHECLISILQLFHDVLAKNVKYQISGDSLTESDKLIEKAHQDWITYYQSKHSLVLETFCGQIRTEMICLNCRIPYYTFDPVMCIDLPLVQPLVQSGAGASAGDLNHCLSQFTATEQLTSDNLYLCSHCHIKTCAYKRNTLWTLPNILIIKLNRFQYQIINGTYTQQKISGLINYPICGLDLRLFVSSPLENQTVYDLCAVTCHVGSLMGGHYYAICYNHINRTWIRYNDDKHDMVENPLSEDAFILFYQRRL